MPRLSSISGRFSAAPRLPFIEAQELIGPPFWIVSCRREPSGRGERLFLAVAPSRGWSMFPDAARRGKYVLAVVDQDARDDSKIAGLPHDEPQGDCTLTTSPSGARLLIESYFKEGGANPLGPCTLLAHEVRSQIEYLFVDYEA